MAYEIEVKARITSEEHTSIRKRLEMEIKDCGFEEKYDLYFKKLDETEEYLRLRKCSSKNVLLTYKNHCTYEETEVNKEIEIEVSNFDETVRLLEALGYVVSFYKKKISHVFKSNDICYELVEIAQLGLFLEIEKLVQDENDIQSVEKAKIDVLEALFRLNIKKNRIEKKSYKSLLGYI